MCERIRLSRNNNEEPWGFRLVGGRDFGIPLTIVRITGGSIAEQAGLLVRDMITEINGQRTNNLTHNEAQKRILQGGNFLLFDVLRGSPVPLPLTPVRVITPITTTEIEVRSASAISIESVASTTYEELNFSESQIVDKREPTEEEIDQMLLENAEVLEEKGKNVIGVNFNRFIPKCDFIKDSAVFQVLQEEQVHKELSEKEQLARCPNMRFSTFLAHPDRPIPEMKKKCVKPDTADGVQDSSSPTEESHSVPTYEDNKSPNEETCCENVCTAETMDKNSVTTNDETLKKGSEIDEEVSPETNAVKHSEIDEEVSPETNAVKQGDEIDVTSLEDSTTEVEEIQEPCPSINEIESSTDKESEFDQQLAQIKFTLDSLRSLPSLIESQLSDVQKQLQNLIDLKTQNKKKDDECCSKEEQPCSKEETESIEYEQVKEYQSESEIQTEMPETSDEADGNEDKMGQDDREIEDETEEKRKQEEHEIERTENEQTIEDKNQNDGAKENQEKKKKERPVCPLTPLPRPVVLPGGRCWRKPKDAFNEEFIAETLISQAEVLVGSTIGVNFRKYQPPKFDLSNSAVYRLIHDMESKAKGIENRPEKVPAEQDYYQSPISARHFYCASLALKSNETTMVLENLS